MVRKVKLELTIPQAEAVRDAISERLAGEFDAREGRMLNRVLDSITAALPEEP